MSCIFEVNIYSAVDECKLKFFRLNCSAFEQHISSTEWSASITWMNMCILYHMSCVVWNEEFAAGAPVATDGKRACVISVCGLALSVTVGLVSCENNCRSI